MNYREGMTAMTSDDDSVAFVNDRGMALTGFGFPSDEANFLVLNLIGDVFSLGFDC